MEDKIKVLETKLKLTKDILSHQNSLIWDLNRRAESARSAMIHAKASESTNDIPIFNFTKEQLLILEDLIYTARAKDLVSQNTQEYLRDYAQAIQIKQEILDGL